MYIDAFSTPYLGEIACSGCLTKLQVSVSLNTGTTVARKNPSLDDLKLVWDDLAEIEQHSLREASLCIGAGAYTASEAMSLRTLEALLRRVYQVNEMFGQLLTRMEQDVRLKEFHGVFHYFKDTRNRVSHPEKLSSRLDAESTFQMAQRLILEVVRKV
jgi:hypothetical protein